MDISKKCISFYEHGDFDKAIQECKQVIRVLKDRPEDREKNDGLFSAYLHLGLSYLGKGKEPPAKESFNDAFRVPPHRKLDPDQYPPKVISLYNEIIYQNLATITITSNLPEAEIFVDEEKKGAPPLKISQLFPGMHSIKVLAAGQESTRQVMLEPGAETTLTFDFRTTGALSLSSEPQPASVYLDGKMMGNSPLLLRDVPAGEHAVRFSKEGYRDFSEKVVIKINDMAGVHAKLEPVTYRVKLNSVPEEALVYWDDVLKGKTPSVFEDVTAGIYKVKLVREGYQEQIDTIEVKTSPVEKTYQLSPDTGSISIMTEPPGARVFMGDKDLGVTPLTVNSCPVDRYVLKLKKDGYLDKEITAVIKKDSMLEINEELAEADFTAPEIIFTPLARAIRENRNIIRAKVTDNKAVGEVSLMIRAEGETNFQSFKMNSTAKGIYETTIPEPYLKKGSRVSYYITACDLRNNCSSSATKNSPYKMNVISLEPYSEGYVLDVGNDRVTVSVGTADGVKKKDKYVVFRPGKELKDPETGELLHVEEIFVGTLIIKELLPMTSYAVIDDKVLPVERNDRIRKQVSAPSALTTEGSFADKIVLRWAPNQEPEIKGYRVYRSRGLDNEFKNIETIKGRDNTVFEDRDGMMEGITYYYAVSAYTRYDSEGFRSEVITGRTKKGVSPPDNFRSEGVNIGEIVLRWSRSSDPDLDKYIIYRADTAGDRYTEITTLDRDIETYADRNNLKDGKDYYYVIAGKSRYGSVGEFSAVAAAKTRQAPSPPEGVIAQSNMPRSARLKWSRHQDAGVAGYLVYRNNQETGPYTEIGKTEKTEFLDKDLADNKTYYYIVASYFSANGSMVTGPASKPVSATTKKRPSAPSDVSAESGLAKRVNVKWTKNREKDIVGYRIFRGKGIQSGVSSYAEAGPRSTAFADTDVKDGTKYIYAVAAVDADGIESDLSFAVSATTKARPLPPSGLKGRAQAGRISLAWNSNKEKDIDRYNIYKKGWLQDTLLASSKGNSGDMGFGDESRSIRIYITAQDKDGLESEPSETIEIILR